MLLKHCVQHQLEMLVSPVSEGKNISDGDFEFSRNN